MPLDLVTLRCLQDNYAYLLHGEAGTVLIDAPEALPILTELNARGWRLDAIPDKPPTAVIENPPHGQPDGA